MTIVTPTIGQTNWGPPLNAALNDLQGQLSGQSFNAVWMPSDQGYVTWSVDPANASNSTVLTAGVMALTRVAVRTQPGGTVTVTNIEAGVNVAGVTLTAGQNFAALYNPLGTRVGVTADQSATWNSIGHKTMAISGGPIVLGPGYYWVAFLSNGTTPPQMLRASQAAANSVNSRTTAATTRFGTFGAAQTVTPASITPGTIASNVNAWFAGLS